MNANNNDVWQEERAVSLGRHKSQCSLCRHPDREEIEREWVGWGNTTQLAQKSKLSRDCIYRHMHALRLDGRRQNNIKAAFERIIERADTVPLTGSTIIATLKAYTLLCEREEGSQKKGPPQKELLEHMSKHERDGFTQDGSHPVSSSSEIDASPKHREADELDATPQARSEGEQGATPMHSQQSQKVGQVIETNDLQ